MPHSSNSWDVLVVGGGAIGLSLAWELSKRGQRVCVVDAGRVGRATSWAGAGILPPTALAAAADPYEQLRSLSSRLHANWAEQLLATTGIDTGYLACGGIYLGRTLAENATLQGNQFWWSEHAIPFERWDLQRLREREPHLNHALLQSENRVQAWWLPSECQIRNPRHLQALSMACQQQGVELLEMASVRELDRTNESVRAAVLEDGTRLFAGQVCLASGAWTRQFLDSLNLATGLMPVRGQIVLFRTSQPLLSSVVNDGNRYLVSRSDGRLLAGSVEEEVGFACETTPDAIRLIQAWAEELLPAVAGQVEQTWAGLRPGTYDGLPYLGSVPGFANLFVAAGHFRSGLHLSTGTAAVMADLMCGQSPEVDVTPFRVGRG